MCIDLTILSDLLQDYSNKSVPEVLAYKEDNSKFSLINRSTMYHGVLCLTAIFVQKAGTERILM